MRSRKGTGFVIALAAFASIGVTASLLGNTFQDPGTEAVASTQTENRSYADDPKLDRWINDALKVMKQQGIPGTYNSIHRNVIRESGGNPEICNNNDINAQNGIPSCGLLQVIPPTFDAHKLPQSAYDKAGVTADADNRLDPVANIVTACAYAWSRYPNGLQIKGKQGINGVNGPY